VCLRCPDFFHLLKRALVIIFSVPPAHPPPSAYMGNVFSCARSAPGGLPTHNMIVTLIQFADNGPHSEGQLKIVQKRKSINSPKEQAPIHHLMVEVEPTVEVSQFEVVCVSYVRFCLSDHQARESGKLMIYLTKCALKSDVREQRRSSFNLVCSQGYHGNQTAHCGRQVPTHPVSEKQDRPRNGNLKISLTKCGLKNVMQEQWRSVYNLVCTQMLSWFHY
jgi:hypothetical protein